MNDCLMHPLPGRHVALQWVAPEADPIASELALAGVALAALDAFCDVVEPLAAELVLICSDRDERWPRGFTRPPRAFHYLRASDLLAPAEVVRTAPTYNGAEISEMPRLDHGSLRGWIERALAQPCDQPDSVTAWAELSVPATGARLYRDHAERTLIVQSESGPLEAPVLTVNGARWACGPMADAEMQPPIALTFRSEGGVVSLKIHVHWSWWTMSGSPERQALDRALDAIRRSGWEEISNDVIES